MYLIKRVKTGKFLSHLFVDNLNLAYTGTSKADSYYYSTEQKAKDIVDLESNCNKDETFEVFELKTLLQSTYTYDYEMALELANTWIKLYKIYFTCVKIKVPSEDVYSTGNWLVTNKFDPRVAANK